MFKYYQDLIPTGRFGELHTESMKVYDLDEDNSIMVRFPGKYQDRTQGGDFVVCYTGELNGKQVRNKRVTYQDLFKHWCTLAPVVRQQLLEQFARGEFYGVFAQAVLTLTVAEYRRYKQHERCSEAPYAFQVPLSDGTVKGYTGGRWLLLNYLKLLHDDDTLLDAACKLVKTGSTGLEILSK